MGGGEVTINQITWQVGSLREVGDSLDYLRGAGRSRGTGRPRHAGLELARLSGRSRRPHQRAVLRHRAGRLGRLQQAARDVQPRLPRTAAAAADLGVRRGPAGDRGGHRPAVGHAVRSSTSPRVYDVDGILLARPFKIVRIGPVRLFVHDLERSLDYYTRVLGLRADAGDRVSRRSVRVPAHQHRAPQPGAVSAGAARRAGVVGAHNVPELRRAGGKLPPAQGRRGFLARRGVQIRELPPELSPGIDYSALAIDPDGHAVQLYYYMQQVGPDGHGRRAGAQGDRLANWPATVEARRGYVYGRGVPRTLGIKGGGGGGGGGGIGRDRITPGGL